MAVEIHAARSREIHTIGQWPPAIGDLVIRAIGVGEQCPSGWTEFPGEGDTGEFARSFGLDGRPVYRTWTGTEVGVTNAVALRPSYGPKMVTS